MSTAGEAQWFQPTVRNRLSETVVLANFIIQWGKFYDIKNPFDLTVSPQGTKIESKGEFEWGHCGRSNSPSGTEGTFEVHLETTGEKIAEVYWDCPWGIGNNKIMKRFAKPGYDISLDGFMIPSGALGLGKITVLEDTKA